ncbi:hypothetical protein [Pseudomonas fluorescens group sp. PF-69]
MAKVQDVATSLAALAQGNTGEKNTQILLFERLLLADSVEKVGSSRLPTY